ncbi:hypothetical protein H9L39_16511 [Fusarium oxysporum f. sp. albedinis]|nr:hypothetical protein H9L39_16511 [Fusarium oxysporum f. sp. albedinis]
MYYICTKQLDPKIFHASSRSPYHNAMCYSLTSSYLIPCPASPGQPVQRSRLIIKITRNKIRTQTGTSTTWRPII